MLRRNQYEDLSDFGVNICDAVILEYIFYWVNRNEKFKKTNNYKDGKFWTYNSVKKITSKFGGIISCDTVRRSINKLLECGLIEKGNFNEKKYDRTFWYSLTDEAKEILNKIYKDDDNEDEEEDPKEKKHLKLPFQFDLDFRKKVADFLKKHLEIDPEDFIFYCYDLSQRLSIDNPRLFFQKKIIDENTLENYKAIVQRDKSKELKPEPYQVPEAPPVRTAEDEKEIDNILNDLNKKIGV